MAKFVELERPSGTTFFVNADHVAVVVKGQSEKETTVHMIGGRPSETVKGTPSDIAKKLMS
ncbi:MAG: hypothetical protein L0Y71_00445 [Gemmataceae bacterium]|nr:hypothetical protein [Gemmataceae bacterium]